MYITNLKDHLQKHCTKLYEEKGPKDKKPAAKNRPFERPSQANLSLVSKLYEESGSETSLILVLFPNCLKNLVVKIRTLKKMKKERII